MKFNKSNKYTRSIAVGLSLLVGSSVLSGFEKFKELHIYEKQGVVKIIDSNAWTVDGYIRTEDSVPFNWDLAFELRVIDYYGLVRVSDNVSYIENCMNENKSYIEYEYVYYKKDTDHCFNDNGIYINKIDNIDSVSVDGFKRVVGYTKDENIITYTGNQRLVKTKYKVYKLVFDDFGRYYLIQDVVDNPLDSIDEFPYFKPNKFEIIDYTDVSIGKIKIK